MLRYRNIVLAISIGTATAASAQMPTETPKCPADAEPVPESLTGWSARTALIAASDPRGLKAATLTPGQAVDATLTQTAGMTYVTRPEKPGGSVSYGGLFAFAVPKAGTYRVALGSGAWIDILKGKASVQSVAHGHGPACSGIRKMVDFALEPGSYVLQIAANGAPQLPVLLTRLP